MEPQSVAPKPCFSLHPATSLSRFSVPKEKGRNLGHAKGYSWIGGGLVLGPKFKCMLRKEERTGHKRDQGRQALRLCRTWASGWLQEQVCALCSLIRAHSRLCLVGIWARPWACVLILHARPLVDADGAHQGTSRQQGAHVLTSIAHTSPLLAPAGTWRVKGAGSMGRIWASAHSQQPQPMT